MRAILGLGLAGFAALVMMAWAARWSVAEVESAAAADAFAVVELFTSQGCSSCPPAERVAHELIEDAESYDGHVIVLSCHVDYWDHLGWKDPLGDAAFSARQREYARTWRERTVYTPQMVVNGTTGFVGSSRRKAESAIRKALEKQPEATISLACDAGASDDDGWEVEVRIDGAGIGGDFDLNVALVQRHVRTRIARGENAGRTLEQANVVRRLKQLPAGAAAQRVRLEREPDWRADDFEIVAFLQHRDSRRVVAATSIMLPGP